MSRSTSVKGFPEWLPDQRMVEQHLIDIIRARYELHGFVPVETRAVEPVDVLTSKGEVDKEIYVLRRIHAEDDDGEAGLGLHFDLTVPFARYVVQNRGKLLLPLRRYQIQKVWRGERPQDGRFREFYQCDADVIGSGALSTHYDTELALILHDVLSHLPVPPVTIRVNNRKVLEGFYRALGIEDLTATLRIVDKLDKIGPQRVIAELTEKLGVAEATAQAALSLASIRGGREVVGAVEALGYRHPLLEEGLAELDAVLQAATDLPENALIADLKIARGLDYYTGTVYEGTLQGHEGLGSVCSGGRYDNLAASLGSKEKLPGIGVSIGLSRILARLFSTGGLKASRQVPTCVLVALPSAVARPAAMAVARRLREGGVAAEVFDQPRKYGDQIKYASQRGIPWVYFLPDDQRPTDTVRDLRSGAQVEVDSAWLPPEADWKVTFLRG